MNTLAEGKRHMDGLARVGNYESVTGIFTHNDDESRYGSLLVVTH